MALPTLWTTGAHPVQRITDAECSPPCPHRYTPCDVNPSLFIVNGESPARSHRADRLQLRSTGRSPLPRSAEFHLDKFVSPGATPILHRQDEHIEGETVAGPASGKGSAAGVRARRTRCRSSGWVRRWRAPRVRSAT